MKKVMSNIFCSEQTVNLKNENRQCNYNSPKNDSKIPELKKFVEEKLETLQGTDPGSGSGFISK